MNLICRRHKMLTSIFQTTQVSARAGVRGSWSTVSRILGWQLGLWQQETVINEQWMLFDCWAMNTDMWLWFDDGDQAEQGHNLQLWVSSINPDTCKRCWHLNLVCLSPMTKDLYCQNVFMIFATHHSRQQKFCWQTSIHILIWRQLLNVHLWFVKALEGAFQQK